MEFYEAVRARRTVRQFADLPVEPEAIKRILGAGLAAPTNDHLRDWEFVVVSDKEQAARILKKIPKTVSEKRVAFLLKA